MLSRLFSQDDWAILACIVVAFYVIRIIQYSLRPPRERHWHQTILDFSIDVSEWYAKVSLRMDEAQLPDFFEPNVPKEEAQIEIDTDEKTFKGMKRSKEVYRIAESLFKAPLRYKQVVYKDVKAHLTCFPFGSNMYFGYWVQSRRSTGKILVEALPLIGPRLGKIFYPETMYRQDEHQAFMDSLHTAIIHSVQDITDGTETYSLRSEFQGSQGLSKKA